MPSPARLPRAEPAGVGSAAPDPSRTGVFDRAPSPSSRTRRTQVRTRRWAARGLLAVPALAVIGVDVTLRHARLAALDASGLSFYALSGVVGVLLWVSLYSVAARTRGPARWIARAVIVVGALLAVGGQLYTYDRYQAYVNHRAVLVGTSFLPSIGQQLWFDRWGLMRMLLPWLVMAIAVPISVARLSPVRSRRRGWLCVDLALVATLIAAFVSPGRCAEQGQTPDVMYVSAMGQLARARWDHNETVERVHPGPRSPLAVPPLVASPSAPRNVIMIVTESVRAHSVCVAYDPECRYTPFSNEAARDRFPLTQMRALDSTTAISLAVMWTGLLPTERREALHTAPLLWEYAHAAHIDSAYYTSQNLLFGNSGTWLEGTPWKRHVSATMIEADATYETGADDGALIDITLADLDALKEPYLAVVHLSNTHFPYKVDEHMPFSPDDPAPSGVDRGVFSRYQSAIHLQDIALGRFLREVRKRPEAERTVMVYVSDHGEQMREKGSVGHTTTLFDSEIRIPFWVDAPEGTLSAGEAESLRSLRNAPVTSLDVFPTVMDLLGLWDHPKIAPFRARVAGESLLRGGSPADRAVVMTNCTELWACAFRNWGAIRGTRKLIAHQGERAWSCFDVATDPDESAPLELEACGDLVPLAEGTMGGRPF
jgi:glucan phosphoethanolaminetransferase (alkaline phosphatase superfamily)